MLAKGLTGTDANSLVTVVAAAVLAALIVATLYFGRDVFVPVAFSILLSFALAPLVRALQNFRVPRAISVIGVVLLAFSIIFVIGGVIATQMTQLAGELPRYESNMRAKIQSLRGTAAANNTLERAADVLQDLGKELNKPKEPSSARTAAPPPILCRAGRKADTGRSEATAADSARKHCRSDFAFASPSDDFRHRYHLRNFYVAAKGGFAESLNQACGVARLAKDDCGAQRCCPTP